MKFPILGNSWKFLQNSFYPHNNPLLNYSNFEQLWNMSTNDEYIRKLTLIGQKIGILNFIFVPNGHQET